MKRKYNILIIVLAMFIILTILGIKSARYNKISEKTQEMYNEMKNDSAMYNENSNLNDLKKEYSITGEDNLYEIQTEYDGRKVPVIKADINYKVVFAGMVGKTKPTYNEIDEVFENYYPKENGVWVEKSSREKILNFLNSNLNSKYEINENGYLKIAEKNIQNDEDIKIEKIINENKKYILDISSVCYMVDAVTGEIVDNPYEAIEEYQTYEYFSNENDMIIFITENSENKLTDDEVFESILNLIS